MKMCPDTMRSIADICEGAAAANERLASAPARAAEAASLVGIAQAHRVLAESLRTWARGGNTIDAQATRAERLAESQINLAAQACQSPELALIAEPFHDRLSLPAAKMAIRFAAEAAASRKFDGASIAERAGDAVLEVFLRALPIRTASLADPTLGFRETEKKRFLMALEKIAGFLAEAKP